MKTKNSVKVQQGIWIDDETLRNAGLGGKVQLVIMEGEIRIQAMPEPESSHASEQGWEIFRTLGDDASAGKLADAAANHNTYLYIKSQ